MYIINIQHQQSTINNLNMSSKDGEGKPSSIDHWIIRRNIAESVDDDFNKQKWWLRFTESTICIYICICVYICACLYIYVCICRSNMVDLWGVPYIYIYIYTHVHLNLRYECEVDYSRYVSQENHPRNHKLLLKIKNWDVGSYKCLKPHIYLEWGCIYR